MKTVLAFCMAMALVGCASMREEGYQQRREVASGHVGCPPDEIAVSAHTSSTWTATCRGRVFYCKVGDGTSCKESAPSA